MGSISQVGEEMGYLLEGAFDVTVRDQVFRPERAIRSTSARSVRTDMRTSATVARILWINTLPTF